MFEQQPSSADEDGAASMSALHERILREPSLWPALAGIDDPEQFVQRLVEVAHSFGLPLAPASVTVAMAAARQRHWQRWV